MKKFDQIKAVVIGLLLSSAVVPVALAEDIEIYTKKAAETVSDYPNILFLVDTSGSMGAFNPMEVREHYDPDTVYSGKCVPDGIYFKTLVPGVAAPVCTDPTGTPPEPQPGNYFHRDKMHCDNALYVYTEAGTRENPAVPVGLQLFGTYSDQLARLDTSKKNTSIWETLGDTIGAPEERDYIVECLADSGSHGSSGSAVYIADETGGNVDGYTSTVPANLNVPHPVWDNGAGHMILWDGNYLNYRAITEFITVDGNEEPNPDYVKITTTRLEEMKRAVDIMVSTNSRVNIGLISLDENREREGGAVQYHIQDIGKARSNFKKQVLPGLNAEAYTTLSETYYESLLYFGGKAIDYGAAAAPATVGSAKSTGGKYKSPISSVCGANYIVVLSDGVPTADDPNTENAAGVARFSLLTDPDGETMSQTVCNVSPTLDVTTDDNENPTASRTDPLVQNDNCLDDLSYWASTNDVAIDASFEIDGVKLHEGVQNISTHTIGFALQDEDGDTDDELQEKADARALLDSAKAGVGEHYSAQTGDDLVGIFQEIIAGALDYNTTFSSPAVSVNAFNRSTHLNDLYFTLFQPHATNNSWFGNLKKYKLEFTTGGDPFIADADSDSAVDPETGFFDAGARSYWTAEGTADGFKVDVGGAASGFTAARKELVYTVTGSDAETSLGSGVYVPAEGDLKLPVNRVEPTNAELSDPLLGIENRDEILEGTPYRETLLDWARGLDVFSDYGTTEGDTSDARLNMGDPLHAEPALVQYGQTADGKPELVAYVATNDGYLHAFDADTGKEYFSFIPQELLKKLPGVMENNVPVKSYGLDGSVVAWVNDIDGNGTIDGSDKVILYFGMRRGGKNIYAVDVTIESSPKLLWVIKGGIPGAYAELGQTWSTINVEKIKDVNYPDGERTVLIFGGGYDPTQDNATQRRVDTTGTTVFIADALSGERLWSAKTDLANVSTDMLYSIPARVKPLDITGNGLTDRIYAVDMGGQIFRFDINNTGSNALVATIDGEPAITGGRIADLAVSDSPADARRFYYPPDVAQIDAPDGVYHGLVISSGFRAHPLDETVHDRIYMIKDRHVGPIRANADYKYKENPTDGEPDILGALTEEQLRDMTTNLAGGEATDDDARDIELGKIQSADGWYINLDDETNPGTWIGEKGLAEPLIIEGIAIITTYVPPQDVSPEVCVAPEGTGKVFYLDMLDATAAYPSDADARSERSVILARGGIPPTPTVLITPEGVPTKCIGTECSEADFNLGIRKTYWYEVEN